MKEPKISEMTLLDYFAGQILASGVLDEEDGTMQEAARELDIADYHPRIHWPRLRAKHAYDAAEALMNERKRRYG